MDQNDGQNICLKGFCTTVLLVTLKDLGIFVLTGDILSIVGSPRCLQALLSPPDLALQGPTQASLVGMQS